MVKKEVVRLVGMMEISTKKDENVGKSQFVKRQMKENKNKRTWLDRQIDRQMKRREETERKNKQNKKEIMKERKTIDEKKRRDREKKQTE